MSDRAKQYEMVFASPLLAMAFKDGVEFSGDPDIRVSYPQKSLSTSNWIVVITELVDDDNTDDEEDDNEAPIEAEFVECDDQSDKVSFEEFQELTRGNMKPVVPRMDPTNVMPCGGCIPCSMSDGSNCITLINRALCPGAYSVRP